MPNPTDQHPSTTQNMEAGVDFHFRRSNYYRSIFAEGAIGGITPKGILKMNLYTERYALPTKTRHRVTEDDHGYSVGPEDPKFRESLQGFERELEVEVLMNIDTAAALYEWLGKQLETLTKAKNESDNGDFDASKANL
jgi:hypothetical protein